MSKPDHRRGPHRASNDHTPAPGAVNQTPHPHRPILSPPGMTRATTDKPHPIRRRALKAAGWLMLVAALTLLAAWIVGRAASDRWGWSQWLFWAIAPAGSIPAGLALLLAAGLLRLARTRVRWITLSAVAVTAWTPIIGWRLWVWPVRAVLGPPTSSLRLVHWNPAAKRADFARTLSSLDPDIVVISNPPNRSATSPSPEFEHAALPLCHVHSRFPIRAWGTAWLGLTDLYEDREREWHERPQSGWASFVEIDSTADLGRPLVVWIVDLPSSPEVPRREAALRARRAIESWTGPLLRPGEGDTITREPAQDVGFPAADVIVGDFNTPRGAWSASRIAAPLTSAFHDVGLGGGVGRCVTWPRERPLYQLDQAFVRDWLRSCRYEVRDPGATPHRIQILDLGARD